MTDKTVTVTAELIQILEATCNILTQVAELQYDEDARSGMYAMAETIAHSFDIEMHYVEETVDEEGNTVITIAEADRTDTDPDPDSTVH